MSPERPLTRTIFRFKGGAKMIYLFIMFLSWGLWQKALMPLWVPIVLTVFATIEVLAECRE